MVDAERVGSAVGVVMVAVVVLGGMLAEWERFARAVWKIFVLQLPQAGRQGQGRCELLF